MKKQFKIPLTIFIVVLLNLLFKGLFINQHPNSIALDEIHYLQTINIHIPFGNYFFRIFNLVISTLISLTSFFLVYRQSKHYLLGLLFAIELIFTPWVFIITRFFNWYLLILLLVIIVLFIVPNRFLRFSSIGLLLLTVGQALIELKIENLQYINTKLVQLFAILDFNHLFFLGDTSSRFANIPLTGFFMYFELTLLIIGFYSILTRADKKIRSLLFELTLIALVSFFLQKKDSLHIFLGLFWFYLISLIVAIGITKFLEKNINRRFLVSVVFGFILVNIGFYQELFYSHFDKNNSFEWGYAENSAISYYRTNRYQNILLSEESGKLKQYLDYFRFTDNQVVSAEKMKGRCQYPSLCIVREQELPRLNLTKDQVKRIFRHFDGLPMYFVINNLR